ncbi:MAG: hypothetical protein ACYSTY_02190 [Planctomycetota bacterium]|jgi:hypothetical protein
MVRIGLAGLIGAVVLMVWSSVSWMIIPWHQPDVLPRQERIMDALRDSGAESGIYWMPNVEQDPDATEEQQAAAVEAWKEAHRQGPIGVMVYRAEGSEPMPAMLFVVGFVLDFILAAVAALLLTMAAPALPTFVKRLSLVMLIGVFSGVGSHLMNWNWMNYPLRFSLEMFADTLVASLLLGVVLALMIGRTSGAGGGVSDYDASPV